MCNPPGEEDFFKTLTHYPTLKCRNHLVQGIGNNPLPLVSHAFTRGIEIIASSHYDPLRSDLISYSIRMRIVTDGEEGYMSESERGYTSCQLISRHWVILDGNSNDEQTVNGEGVIGFYPLLCNNSHRADYTGRSRVNPVSKGSVVETGTFRYQSYVSSSCKAFRGRIRFIPGSINNPTGEPFFADLAPFALVSETEITF